MILLAAQPNLFFPLVICTFICVDITVDLRIYHYLSLFSYSTLSNVRFIFQPPGLKAKLERERECVCVWEKNAMRSSRASCFKWWQFILFLIWMKISLIVCNYVYPAIFVDGILFRSIISIEKARGEKSYAKQKPNNEQKPSQHTNRTEKSTLLKMDHWKWFWQLAALHAVSSSSASTVLLVELWI